MPNLQRGGHASILLTLLCNFAILATQRGGHGPMAPPPKYAPDLGNSLDRRKGKKARVLKHKSQSCWKYSDGSFLTTPFHVVVPFASTSDNSSSIPNYQAADFECIFHELNLGVVKLWAVALLFGSSAICVWARVRSLLFSYLSYSPDLALTLMSTRMRGARVCACSNTSCRDS